MESKTKGAMWKSLKTVSESGVKSDPAFCFGTTIEKTNSETCYVIDQLLCLSTLMKD